MNWKYLLILHEPSTERDDTFAVLTLLSGLRSLGGGWLAASNAIVGPNLAVRWGVPNFRSAMGTLMYFGISGFIFCH